jgi:hypothetical protein
VGTVPNRASQKLNKIVIMRLGFGDLLEVFLIAAVACVLFIRFALAATGYPQLGGGGLHIAHMLWGGLGMLVALVLVFVSLGRRGFFVAALIGGLGFGAFIDEIGKFVTSNNDYFYQPAVAMIYVAFMLLYVAGRMIEHLVRPSSRTYLANALELLKEAAARDLSTHEKQRAHAYLRLAGSEPLAPAIAAVLDQAEAVPVAPPGRLTRLAQRARAAYARVAYTRVFTAVLVWFFVVGSLLTLLSTMLRIGGATRIVLAAMIAIALAAALIRLFRSGAGRRRKVIVAAVLVLVSASLVAAALWQSPDAKLQSEGFVQWCDTISALAVGGLVLTGIWRLQVSRLAAYRWFLRAVLFEIFFAQVFAFYRDQFWALVGLLVSILIWAVLHYAVRQEEMAALDAPAEGQETPVTAVAGIPPA